MTRILDINEADIVHFYNHDTTNAKSYSGLLVDGETIYADYFHAGPMAGKYYSNRITKLGLEMPLKPYKKYFNMLKAGFEAKAATK